MTLTPAHISPIIAIRGLKERISARTGRLSQHNFAKCSDIVTRFLYWQNENSCKIGAALGPIREPCGSDLTPAPRKPRGRSRHFYNELWPLGGRKALAVTNSSGLLRLGHMAFGPSS